MLMIPKYSYVLREVRARFDFNWFCCSLLFWVTTTCFSLTGFFIVFNACNTLWKILEAKASWHLDSIHSKSVLFNLRVVITRGIAQSFWRSCKWMFCAHRCIAFTLFELDFSGLYWVANTIAVQKDWKPLFQWSYTFLV